MARRDDPDYVSGKRGRYQISPPVVHPAHCRCGGCGEARKAIGRDGQVIGWDRPVTIRVRRRCPAGMRDSRLAAAAYAQKVKREIEDALAAGVDAAHASRVARIDKATVGSICSAYRDHCRKRGKRLDRAQYVIRTIEGFFGAFTDPEFITKDDYRKFCAKLEENGAGPATILRHTNTLVAILNSAKTDDLIAGHQLTGIRRPVVRVKKRPVTFTRIQTEVLLGPAMDRYEAEQRQAIAGYDPETHRKPPSEVPMRGLCLVAYRTLMRPQNNYTLRRGQLFIHPTKDVGTFILDEHKNAAKGIEVQGALHPQLVRYLRARLATSTSEFVHPNLATGEPYRNIRKQWARLVAIANEILAEKFPDEPPLEGKRAQFYTWRHTGASRLAEISNPVMIGRMMGDTSLKTIMDHYFDASLETMAKAMERWAEEEPQQETAAIVSGRRER